MNAGRWFAPFLVAAILLTVGCAADPGAEDAGGRHDAGLTADSGTDAGTDAGTPCPAAFAGCTAFEDRTGAGDDRSVTFDFTPVPKCLKVRAGQSVTFNGPSAVHPLSQACGPAEVIPDHTTSSGSFTFSDPGDYGYFCDVHGTSGGAGMAGAVQVIP